MILSREMKGETKMIQKKMGRPAVEGQKRSVQVQFMVTPVLAKKIKTAAKRVELSASEWMRSILYAALKK